MRRQIGCLLIILAIVILLAGCQKESRAPQPVAPSTLADVPAARLNFHYEPDVPGPVVKDLKAEERSSAVQADFDQARPEEILDRSLTSPDKKHILAVYHRASDVASEYRLDMYSGEGRLQRKITPDAMAVHFPETIVWAPDSSSVAFVAMVRAGQGDSSLAPVNPPVIAPTNSVPDSNTVPANTGENADNANVSVTNVTVPTPTPPSGILTLGTEQLYTCNADGDGTKPLTQNQGLIYFYYLWSPDGSMLAALAATSREWQVLQSSADSKGEAFIPAGRLRVVEKNGRERRLDDAPTSVRPVWSPDSAKVAEAFGTQIRVYDAGGITPTQAAVPLRNQLLISSQAYDRDQQQKLQAANSNEATNSTGNVTYNAEQATTTLPDEKSLVSFNPIVELDWTSDDILYLRTAYVKRMKNDADSVTSFARWHRLIFSYQGASN